jgi:hypothetical protein
MRIQKEFVGTELLKIEMGLDPHRSKLILCKDEFNCFKIVTITLD